MPVFFQHNINQSTRLVVWHLQESEDFFYVEGLGYSSITHQHKRLQHMCGRFLLKYLFNDFPYNQIIINDTGKPYLSNRNYHFSISHTTNYVTAIVSTDYEVGIDIELIRPTALKIAHKFLSEAEQKDLEINNERSATLCWSIKEAVYKYCGQKSMIFKKDIFIQKIEYKTDCGLASVNITLGEYAITIPVFFQLLDNILFSWMYNK